MKVIVAPFDWGLGHATRCIPVIRNLLSEGHEVMIAADGSCRLLLQQEFPKQQFIHLKGYHISYSSKLPAWLKILIQLPKILFRIISEHRELKRIIDEYHPDVVISDNRFGFWNENVKSIYITHQVMIKCPRGFKLFEWPLYLMHRWVIHHYDECRIPDYEGNENLSGDLSHHFPKPQNAKYIGLLSRFNNDVAIESKAAYDLCVIISGPEPARSEFEKIVFRQVKSFQGRVVIVLGKLKDNQSENYQEFGDTLPKEVKVFSHLNADQLKEIILQSRVVLCRAGYSGIMDLIALQKDAVLVPTPGQTEQEYLAEYLYKKRIFRNVRQDELDLKTLAEENENFRVTNFVANETGLSEDQKTWEKREMLNSYL